MTLNYWIASDWHFGHTNLQKYCDRPENADELILKGLSIIPEGDLLFFLGDICICNDEYWHEKLNEFPFRKILIRGNHDKKSDSWYLEHGWDSISKRMDISIFGKRIIFTHWPMDKEYSHTEGLNIHGHWHNNENVMGYYKDNRFLFVLEHHYKPILLRNIVENKLPKWYKL